MLLFHLDNEYIIDDTSGAITSEPTQIGSASLQKDKARQEWSYYTNEEKSENACTSTLYAG